jgi:hypothetical protein
MEVLGLPSLAVAVGVYLPISTSAAIFLGGMVRWLIERRTPPALRGAAESDSGPGVLFASGLIAGGAIMGVVFAGLQASRLDQRLSLAHAVGAVAESPLVGLGVFVGAILVPLYLAARRTDVPPAH